VTNGCLRSKRSLGSALLSRHATFSALASDPVQRGHASQVQFPPLRPLPEGRTTPVPGQGAGVLTTTGQRERVQRLLDALLGVSYSS
jgi:hypothetical protein